MCGWLTFLGRLNRLISRRALLVLRFALYRDKPQVSWTIRNASTMMDLCSLNVSLVAGSLSGVVLGGVCRAFVVSGAVSVLRASRRLRLLTISVCGCAQLVSVRSWLMVRRLLRLIPLRGLRLLRFSLVLVMVLVWCWMVRGLAVTTSMIVSMVAC